MLLVVAPLLVAVLLFAAIVGVRERAIAARELSAAACAARRRGLLTSTAAMLATWWGLRAVDAPPAERAAVAPFDWVQHGGFALVVAGPAALVGAVLALTWVAPLLPASRDCASPKAFGAHQRVAP